MYSAITRYTQTTLARLFGVIKSYLLYTFVSQGPYHIRRAES